MILNARNIIKKFNNQLVLDSIDISIDKSQIISIQGSSGTGKTTFLNILGLLDAPSYGKVEYYNHLEYDNFNSSKRVNTVGYIFSFTIS